MSCLKTLCKSSRCVSFSSPHIFFQTFESRHLTRVMSELPRLCVLTDEKKAGCSDPTLLWGVRDKAPRKAATPS